MIELENKQETSQKPLTFRLVYKHRVIKFVLLPLFFNEMSVSKCLNRYQISLKILFKFQ